MALRGLFGGRKSADVLAEHRARAAPHLGLLQRRATAEPELASLEPDEALSLLIVALTLTGDFGAHSVASQLVRRRLPYALDDARLLVEMTERARSDVWIGRLSARAALAALELRAGEGDDVKDLAKRLLAVVVGPHHYEAAEWTKLGSRVRKLAAAVGNGKVDLLVLKGDDPWSEHVRPLVRARFAVHAQLLDHLASATQSRPSRRWLNETTPLLVDDAPECLRVLLEAADDVSPRRLGSLVIDGREYVNSLWLSDISATVIRGALWAASLVNEDWVVPMCERLIARAQQFEQIKVGNACCYCLGARADDEAVALLARLVAKVKDRRFLKPAQAALEAAAEQRGITSDQLREQLVPTFGLDPDGRHVRHVGPAEVALQLEPPAAVKLRYKLGDKESASAPEALKLEHESELAELKQDVAALRKELALQRWRVEELLAADRVWEYDEWRSYYLEHPLVQLFARRLIWQFDERAAIPLERDRFLTLESSIEPPRDASVRLWHPLEASKEEIVAWRALLLDRQLRQPFKQAHREIYLLAPAERETEVYSNRFAAHIVRYDQLYALAKQRSWGIRALGPYDNDGGEQWRDFAAHGLRASFWMEMADEDPRGAIAQLASTDQVRFSRLGERDPLPLEDVPARVFSEAMRDVDLFVGVASIAADPNWIDGGVERFNAYWHAHAFGELGESAIVRREVLEELIPGLKIADRLELDDRYLRVRGNLNTYKIHLGSANILREPDDRYLCIVPARGAATAKLFLPFDDERLSMILSKALLLAADDKIKDQTIRRQLV